MSDFVSSRICWTSLLCAPAVSTTAVFVVPVITASSSSSSSSFSIITPAGNEFVLLSSWSLLSDTFGGLFFIIFTGLSIILGPTGSSFFSSWISSTGFGCSCCIFSWIGCEGCCIAAGSDLSSIDVSPLSILLTTLSVFIWFVAARANAWRNL